MCYSCDGCDGDGSPGWGLRDEDGRITDAAPGLMGESFDVCPVCALDESWARGIIRATNWRAKGSPVTDLYPDPTPALIDGILTVECEQAAVERDEHERMRREHEARGGSHGSS